MISYTMRRIILLIPILFTDIALVFFIMHLAPGDPVLLLAGPQSDPRIYQELRHQWGFDRPIYVQFAMYLNNLFRGDLGTSLVTGRRVTVDIGAYLPATIELTLVALIIAITLGVAVGIAATVKANSFLDHSVRTFSLFGVATPIFWLGLLLIIVFNLKLGWLPAGGRLSMNLTAPKHLTGFYLLDSALTGNWAAFKSSLIHLILPTFTLAFPQVGRISRITRASMLGIVNLDYVKVGRAKGLSGLKVTRDYILRNAWIPILTMIGEVAGTLFGGAVVTEIVFSWPGMGRYAYQSIFALDYKAIVAFTIVVTLLYAVVNLIVDLLYVWVDPRIVYS